MKRLLNQFDGEVCGCIVFEAKEELPLSVHARTGVCASLLCGLITIRHVSLYLDAKTFDETTVESPDHHIHRHSEDIDTRVLNRPDDENLYLHEVAVTLAGADR